MARQTRQRALHRLYPRNETEAWIAAEQLIGAEAGESDCQTGLARRFRDKVTVDRIRAWLVHGHDDAVQPGGDIDRPDPCLHVLQTKALCGRSRRRALVVAGFIEDD